MSKLSVSELEWVPTKSYNRNDYHGSKSVFAEYRSKPPFSYTLTMNIYTGGSWDATKDKYQPVDGATCVSLEAAKEAVKQDIIQNAKRERHLKFILSFGPSTLKELVEKKIASDGHRFLNVDQLSEIVSDLVQSERSRVHRNIANRKISAEART